MNDQPAGNMELKFNLSGWQYSYWQNKTGANGFTDTNRFDDSVKISSAEWVPTGDFPANLYTLDHVAIDGGKWDVAGGHCADLRVQVYIVSVNTPPSATPTILPLLAVTGPNDNMGIYLAVAIVVLAAAGLFLLFSGLLDRQH